MVNSVYTAAFPDSDKILIVLTGRVGACRYNADPLEPTHADNNNEFDFISMLIGPLLYFLHQWSAGSRFAFKMANGGT